MPTSTQNIDQPVTGTVAAIRAAVLASTDWADITPTATLTTSTAAAAAGATSLTIAATPTTQPGLSVGDIVVIDKGLATEERFNIATRSSTTALTLSGSPFIYAHNSGAVLQYGPVLLKATTTRGAQMVVGLTDGNAAGWPSARYLGVSVFRMHDGTISGGVDRLQRYITFSAGTTGTNSTLHTTVSAGKEHFWLSIEGPRAGESGAQDASNGSARQSLMLCDLVPYHASDTVPAVVCAGHVGNTASDQTTAVYVSRDQGNTQSWVPATALTLARPNNYASTPYGTSTPQPVAKGDGKYYLWPYVIVETADGLRGRLAKVFYAGNPFVVIGSEVTVTPGTKVTYGGEKYVVTGMLRNLGGSSSHTANGLGFGYSASVTTGAGTVLGASHVVAIPDAP
jgi:hypothetical protein